MRDAEAGAAAGDTGARPIEWIRRWRLDGWRIIVAAAVVVAGGIASGTPPPAWEIEIFRTLNELPRQWEGLLWPLQQAGMAMAVPAAAVALWFVVRHWRPPVVLVAGGIVFGWATAKLIKRLVDRARPGNLLEDVRFGFDVPADGLGYPSGHAVVAFTLALVFSPYIPRWLRWVLYGFAFAVCFSRVYMGAHLPLDVVGGAAFGVLIGSAVNLVAGLRRDRVRPEALRLG